MVMAPAKTGKDKSKRIAVIFTDQTNKGTRSNRSPFHRIFITVVMKFKAPKIDEAPAKWREKIARSTEAPAWAILPERGGQTVHPVPTPFSTAADITKRVNEGGKSQKDILFSRGNAISGAPSIKGTNQFPNPPIITGITKKKIIKNACAVTIVLYSWSLPNKAPGCPSSARINSLIEVPKSPAQVPKIK